jgi:hypothetical protein
LDLRTLKLKIWQLSSYRGCFEAAGAVVAILVYLLLQKSPRLVWWLGGGGGETRRSRIGEDWALRLGITGSHNAKALYKLEVDQVLPRLGEKNVDVRYVSGRRLQLAWQRAWIHPPQLGFKIAASKR